jgi:hypothetical protein
MIREYQELPGWTFDIDEKSAGVYEVVARAEKGHVITRVGTEPERLIDACKREAVDLSRRARGG